jgi:hypothetical protein
VSLHDRLPRRRPDVRLEDRDLRTVLVAPGGGAVLELNPIARAVWEQCDGKTNISELAEAICQVFPVPRAEAIADLAALVDELVAADLAEWVDGTAAG